MQPSTWQLHDTLFSVTKLYFRVSSFTDMGAMTDAVRLMNPTIQDWKAVPVGTVIYIPLR